MDQVSLDLHVTETFDLGLRPSVRNTQRASAITTKVTCSHWIDSERALFVGTSDGNINVWKRKSKHDPRTHRIKLSGHLGYIFKFLYLPHYDPQLLLSISADRTICVWDVWSRDLKQRCVQKLVGHGGSVTDVTYVKGFILTCSTDKTVRVWVADPHRELLKYPWFLCVQMINCFLSEPCSLGSLVRATDIESTAVYVGDTKGRLYTLLPSQALYHIADKETKTLLGQGGDDKIEVFTLSERRTQRIHKLSITQIMVIGSEHMVCTLSFDTTLQVHEVNGQHAFSIQNEHNKRFTGMEWNPHTHELIIIDELGNIQFWNIYLAKCLKSLQICHNKLMSVCLSSEDKLVLTTMENIMLCKVIHATAFKEIEGHSDSIVALTIADYGDMNIFSAGEDMTICCWDTYDMSCTSVLKEKKSEITSLLFVPGSLIVTSGHDNGALKLWNVDSGGYITLDQHTNAVTALCWVKKINKDILITAGFDMTVCIWDMTKKKVFSPFPEHVFKGSNKEILCLAYHEGENAIIVGGNEITIQIWELDTREYLGSLENGHTDSITKIGIDGNFIISGSDDGKICIWDIRYHYLIRTFHAFQVSVKDLIVIPYYGLVVTCSANHIKVWNYVSGEVEETLSSLKEFRCLLYHSGEKQVFAGTSEGLLLKFRLPKHKETVLWTEEEWEDMKQQNVDADTAFHSLSNTEDNENEEDDEYDEEEENEEANNTEERDDEEDIKIEKVFLPPINNV